MISTTAGSRRVPGVTEASCGFSVAPLGAAGFSPRFRRRYPNASAASSRMRDPWTSPVVDGLRCGSPNQF